MRYYLILFISLFFFSSLHAYEPGIEVRILHSLVNASPGQIVNIQAEVINNSCNSKILVGHLELPPLWEAIPANNMLFHLGPSQRILQTLMVRAPDTSSPGEYPLSYEVWSRDNLSQIDRDTAKVVIGNSQKTPISMEITSPPLMEVNPDEVVYISALVTNLTDQPFEGKLRATVPCGWSCVPAELLDICLDSEESKVIIYGVKVPAGALAGEHAITIALEDCLQFQRSTVVLIRPKIDITGCVEGICDAFRLNQVVQLYIRYTNKGNVPLRVNLDIVTEPCCPLECSREPFEIAAHETCEIPIVLAPESALSEYSQFLLVKLIDAETGEHLYQNPMTLKFVMSGQNENDPYVNIPGYVKGLVMGDRDKLVLGVELAGGGLIDPAKERYFEYFFRLPSDVRHMIYNIDQRIFVGMHDPVWDVRLGDTVYSLSPLTQRFRYGRGGGVDYNGGVWGAGVHYTQNTLKCQNDPHELCSYIQVNPAENVTISTNYLHKTEDCIPTSNMVTVLSEVDLPNDTYIGFEVGKNFLKRSHRANNCGYCFETNGKLGDDTWFSLEKVYAGPEFFGYYNNLRLFSSTLDFPVCDRVRANININRMTQNLSDCFCVNDAVIPRQRQYSASLNYLLTPECTLTLNSLILRVEDMGWNSKYNFFQKWGGFTLSLANQGYQLNTIVSYGQQRDYLTHTTSHLLQQYYVYLSKDISPNLRGSIFYDSGNINYYDAKPWRSGYGGAIYYRFAPTGSIEFFAQRVRHNVDMLDLSQFTVNFDYTFRNLHRLQAMAQYYNYRCHYPDDTVFIVSYAIPFNVPFCRRNDIGTLEGSVYNVWDDCPVPGALVECESNYATTEEDGRFIFPSMCVGEKFSDIAMLPGDLIALNKCKTRVEVPGGSRTQLYLAVAPSCSIKGQITLYGYKDLISMMVDPENAEVIPLNGVQGIRVAIIRNKEEEIYTGYTDEKGVFYFPKLRCGEWHIKIYTEELPPLTVLNINNLVLDVKPGEEIDMPYKLLPIPPKIYKMDSDTESESTAE